MKKKIKTSQPQTKFTGSYKKRVYHANVNVNLMEENVIQINGEKTVNVDVSVKYIIYVKKIIF